MDLQAERVEERVRDDDGVLAGRDTVYSKVAAHIGRRLPRGAGHRHQRADERTASKAVVDGANQRRESALSRLGHGRWGGLLRVRDYRRERDQGGEHNESA
jgi:hypothetical protein